MSDERTADDRVDAARAMAVATLADRKRQLVRDELSRAALGLLASQGFEDTTIDQIVDLAGVSRRTFFRYFESKEDVFVEFMSHAGDRFMTELTSRPVGESVATSLQRAFSLPDGPFDKDPNRALQFARLTLGTPALHARYLERQFQWRAGLAEVLCRRSGLGTDDLRPWLAAAVALVAFDTALTRWLDVDGSQSLDGLVEQTFSLVAASLDSMW